MHLVGTRTSKASAVPKVGAVVIARVTKITARQAYAEIVSVDGAVAPQPFKAVLRKVDVREFEVDKIAMEEAFLPGDVIRAEVLSLGDARSYFISTARAELGVVHSLSEVGEPMVPVSWEEMECPVTKVRVKRKVAKPSAEDEGAGGGADGAGAGAE